MSDRALMYRGAVYPWHCDHMGHMNVMWYVGKFDEATWQFFHALGLTLPDARPAVGCRIATPATVPRQPVNLAFTVPGKQR